MTRLRKFWRLSQLEKLAFYEAYFLLLLSNLSVKMLAFRHLRNFLQKHLNDSRPEALDRVDDFDNDLELIKRSLSRAATLLPWKSLCLSRSIAAFIMLRRRNISAVLFTGVRFLEDSSLAAHAWVQAERQVIGGTAQNAGFTPLVMIGRESLITDSTGNPSE